MRAQIAELAAFEAHLEPLLAHAGQDAPTDHDNTGVCWILETEPAVRSGPEGGGAAPGPPR